MVGGDLLIDDRTLTVIDEEALLEEAQSVARQLFKRAGIDSRLVR